MDSLSKVQGNLPYKNEDRINEAIRRLEHQLRTQNFNVREERKIVSEIDRLKRSKKSLVWVCRTQSARNAGVRNQLCNYWCPGAKAPGH